VLASKLLLLASEDQTSRLFSFFYHGTPDVNTLLLVRNLKIDTIVQKRNGAEKRSYALQVFLSEVAYISFFADLPLQTFHHRE
jgi:hypothetical protein